MKMLEKILAYLSAKKKSTEQRGKTLTIVLVCILLATAFKSIFPSKPAASDTASQIVNDRAVSSALSAMQRARSDLRNERYSRTYSGEDGSIFPGRDAVYSGTGEILYSEDTVLNSISKIDPARSRAMVCRYLYGDCDTSGISGYMSYLRQAGSAKYKGVDPVGCSLYLTLDLPLEDELYYLLKRNGIPGGCIIMDVETGKLDVFTSTSTAQIDNEPSQLTQLEANISGKAFVRLGITPEEAAEYFDYHRYHSTSRDKDGTIMADNYWYTTSFGLLAEPVDGNGKSVPETELAAVDFEAGCISPLHLAGTIQRIFSGRTDEPVLVDQVKDSGGEDEPLPETVSVQIPAEVTDRIKETFNTIDTSHGTIYYIMNDGSGVKYAAGMTEADGKQKAFVIYSQEDERVTMLMPCLADFIAGCTN
ncbi:MAG: hypothetical protein IJ874_03765 [Ruminococcus sp.]|nr:hypothetical protein [Ruminococcus sp.]